MIRHTRYALALLLSAVAAWGDADPQLLDARTTGSGLMLYRPGVLTYDNYGIEGYRPWPQNVLTRGANPIYDEFGKFLVNGVEVYRLQESRRFDDAPGVFSGSTINKPGTYDSYVNRLVVADDSYKEWQTRLIIGDRISTHFSPLVLDQASLNGIRWDLASPSQGFTIAASRLDRPIFTSRDAGILADAAFASYLLGGHWQGRFRTIDVSGSYVNLFRVNTRSSPDWNGMKGQLPDVAQVVDYLVVRIDDSSPRDGEGARVYDIQMFIDGELRTDVVPFISTHNVDLVNRDFPNGDAFFVRPIPPYVEVLLGLQNGEFTPHEPGPEGFTKADARDYVLYWFPIPEGEEVESASFEALVSGNYRIGVSEVYALDPRSSRDTPRTRNRATFFQEVAGSEGRNPAGARMERVRFRYGRQTGVTVTGLGVSTDVKGFRFKADWAHSFNFMQYPVGQNAGARHDRGGDAWLVNVEKDLIPQLAVGGEWFRLEPDYTTQLMVTDLTLSAYTDPPGPFAGELGTTDQSLNNTLLLNSVDDNDDKDPFPDSFFLPSFSDNNGVFPGLDEDLDGLPDTNRNNNRVPDYFEPFLLYDVDPDDFDYGIDLNNNGVIDVREDDQKPDYPYDLNRKGLHLFARGRPQPGLEVTVGSFEVEAIRGGTRSQSLYAAADYRRQVSGRSELRVANFAKRVKDDIPDNVFRYGDIASFDAFNPRATTRVFVEDELLMQDSFVNTAFVGFSFSDVRRFSGKFDVKHEANAQLDPERSGSNLIQLWTAVARSDYRWQLGAFEVSPRYKFMMRKRSDDDGRVHALSEVYSYPMVLARYGLTERTSFKVGIQGFPGLPSLYRNLEDDDQNFETKNYLFMLSNRFDHSGYDLALNAGYEVNQRRMDDRRRRIEDVDYELFFIRMVVGLEPVI